jgi:hypothetical protein
MFLSNSDIYFGFRLDVISLLELCINKANMKRELGRYIQIFITKIIDISQQSKRG